jgi:REase_DpnII-MboI
MAQLTKTNIELATKAYGAARAAVQDCYAQVNAYADADENRPDDFDAEEYLEDMAAHLAELSREAIDALRILLELLSLNETRVDFDNQIAKFGEAEFTKVGYFDEYLGANNVVVDTVRRRLDRIAPLLEIPADVETERRVLARMLGQTPRYLHQLKIVPTKEHDVQYALQPALGLTFPDVIRHPAISKQTKTYHPDFGIDSIATAIEVKFADNEQKAKSVIGELYEDMKGYAASQFTLFIGLVYLTGAYLSQDQVDAELKKVDTPKNWRIYLVFGDGKPKSKHGPAEIA